MADKGAIGRAPAFALAASTKGGSGVTAARGASFDEFAVRLKYYVSPPVFGDTNGNVSGHVSDVATGAILRCIVRLYYRPTGVLLAQTFTDASGYYKFIGLDPNDTGNYTVIALDPDTGTVYNTAIKDRITAKRPVFDQTLGPLGLIPPPPQNTNIYFDVADASWANTGLLVLPLTGLTDTRGRHTMSAVGSAALSYANPKPFGSLRLSAIGDYLSCTDNIADFQFGTGDFTLEGWFYPTSVGGSGRVLLDAYTNAAGGFQLYMNTGGSLQWYSGTGTILSSSSNLTMNAWTHVAVCRVGTSLRMFFNGVQTGSTATDSSSYGAGITTFAIGAQVQTRNSVYDFLGDISLVRVTKGVGRYTTTFIPPVTLPQHG